MSDKLYEVHVEDEPSNPWRHAGQFDMLEEARIEAVHLIRHTPARRVRVVHVVDYYAKPEAAAQARG